MDIIDRISYLLAGREQQELTNYLGLNRVAFSEWKSGKSKSYRKYLIEIAEFFDVSLDYLVYGKETQTALTDNEKKLLEIYSKLADDKKKEAVRRVEELLTSDASENKLTLSQNSISKTNGYEQELIRNFRKLSFEEQIRLVTRAEVMAEMSKAEENIG